MANEYNVTANVVCAYNDSVFEYHATGADISDVNMTILKEHYDDSDCELNLSLTYYQIDISSLHPEVVLLPHIMLWIFCVLSLIASIYGLTSWCLIKKFRHYKNYVFLNIILSIFFSQSVQLLSDTFDENMIVHGICFITVLYFVICFHHWLLVLSYIFYVDFVKVFHIDISRRFLKSSIFAWGMPALIVFAFNLESITIESFDDQMLLKVLASIVFFPIFVNVVIYLLVLYSLFRSKDTVTHNNKWRSFYVSTLIFVLSDVIFICYTLEVSSYYSKVIFYLDYCGLFINKLAIIVYFISAKCNRDLWKEVMKKFLSKNKVMDIELN